MHIIRNNLNAISIQEVEERNTDFFEMSFYESGRVREVKRYFDKVVFEEDILPVLQKARDGVNAQKRKLYVTFIAACIHPDNLDCNNKGIFSNYLDKLDYLSIYILNCLGSYLTEKQLVEKIDSKYDANVILVHLWDLKANDLVDKISAEEYERLVRRYGNIKLRNSQNLFLYKRNKFGGELLNFFIKGMQNE